MDESADVPWAMGRGDIYGATCPTTLGRELSKTAEAIEKPFE